MENIVPKPNHENHPAIKVNREISIFFYLMTFLLNILIKYTLYKE